MCANRLDTHGAVFRLHRLAGMLAVVGLAASTSAAVGPDSAKSVGCCVLLRVLPVSLDARAFRHAPDARVSISCVRAGPSRRNAIATVTT